MILDFVLMAFKNFKFRFLRSLLTVLGIVVAISSIVLLISVSQGLLNGITDSLNTMSPNVIFIQPDNFLPSNRLFSDSEINFIETYAQVEWVFPMSFTSGNLEFKKELFTTTLTAVDDKNSQEKLRDMGVLIDKGRGFYDNEQNVILIGSSFAKGRIFDKELDLNDYLEIDGEKFRVIGIMKEIGSPPDDSSVYIPLDNFQKITSAKNYNYLALKVKPYVNQAEFANELETELIRRLNIDAFSVSTPDKILEQVNDVLDTVKIVVVGIAIISLIVGAVGIANSMFTSVLERRKQIGVMKAVGATNNDIIIMFLIEAGMIGLLGSIFGLFIGTSFSLLISNVANELGYKILVTIDPILIIGLLVFSLIVGIFSGLFPAIEASKLPPSESIRSY